MGKKRNSTIDKILPEFLCYSTRKGIDIGYILIHTVTRIPYVSCCVNRTISESHEGSDIFPSKLSTFFRPIFFMKMHSADPFSSHFPSFFT